MMIRSARILASFVLLFAAWTAPAGAQISMRFEGNQSRVCMNSNAGFDANLALLGPSLGFVSSFLDKRVVTFKPNGTGTVTLKSLRIGHAQTGVGSTPATESEVNCSFTYTLNTVTRVITTDATCNFTILTGPGAGQVGQTTDIRGEAVMLVSGNVLVSQATTPNVETVTNFTTGVVTQQICHRTATSFRTH